MNYKGVAPSKVKSHHVLTCTKLAKLGEKGRERKSKSSTLASSLTFELPLYFSLSTLLSHLVIYLLTYFTAL